MQIPRLALQPCPSVWSSDSETGKGGHLSEQLQGALALLQPVSIYTRAGLGRDGGACSVEKEAPRHPFTSSHQ